MWGFGGEGIGTVFLIFEIRELHDVYENKHNDKIN